VIEAPISYNELDVEAAAALEVCTGAPFFLPSCTFPANHPSFVPSHHPSFCLYIRLPSHERQQRLA
jgi:hypothetical protein